MKLKLAKLHPNAVVPKQAKHGDAGVDLTAVSCEYVENAPVPYYNYDFGIAVEIPIGWVGLIFPRSSVSSRDLMLSNCVGVIDSGYRGPLSARFKVLNNKHEHIYKAGERVAQLVLVPCPIVTSFDVVSPEELSQTERGAGGFGSSGA